uniref:Uncharacterized protein TCIL3000_3_1450 n=1 Tax=Trypanosoma congolense (strain IL3000) TaxID=1068625 RepID=G0UK13_TRYCI|nr:unnamed protein product [Trypanosoma congolense IL3000]
MLWETTLPPSVAAATHVATPSLEGNCGLTADELGLLFDRAWECGQDQLLSKESGVRSEECAPATATAYHSDYLRKFLKAYLSGPSSQTPGAVLSDIRRLISASTGEWLHGCQMSAIQFLLSEWKSGDRESVSKEKFGNDELCVRLRQTLSECCENAPRVSFSKCNFCFVSSAVPSTGGGEEDERPSSVDVTICNDGKTSFSVQISEVYLFIDGSASDDEHTVRPNSGKHVIQSGKTITYHIPVVPLKNGASTIEQIIVVRVNKYVKIFVSVTLLSPSQRPFCVGLPQCLMLMVSGSPIGDYTSPLMLQLLKHQFIRQQGLVSEAAGQLLLGASVQHRKRNCDIIREATRLWEIIDGELDFADVLASHRATLPKKSWGSGCLPASAAQPVGYLPGGVLPTAVSTGSSMLCFPNAATRLPLAFVHASPEVLMGLILIWLAKFDARVFDDSLLRTDPVTYLGLMPPHVRGVVCWVIDLCCALLLHKGVSGVSRHCLALTFAAVLMRKKATEGRDMVGHIYADFYPVDSSSMTIECGETVLKDIELQHCAVAAFECWIAAHSNLYDKYHT